MNFTSLKWSKQYINLTNFQQFYTENLSYLILTVLYCIFLRNQHCAKKICVICIHRSNHQRCSVKKGVLRNFAKFTGKVSFLILLKKRLWRRCFRWILRNSWEYLFYKTPSDDCFCTQAFSDKCSTYSNNWVNENQVYLHLFVHVATIVTSPHMTHNIINVMPVAWSVGLILS